MSEKRFDPLRGYKFSVSSPNEDISCGFSKISGLIENIGSLESEEFKFDVDYNNIILERGLTLDSPLYKWWTDTVRRRQGHDSVDSIRKDVKIRLYERGSVEPVIEWILMGAIPVRYEHGVFDACSADVMLERIELKVVEVFKNVLEK